MLTVGELKKSHDKRASTNHETYKFLYNQVAEHIKKRDAAGFVDAHYTVPAFVIGRPPYTHSHALRYVTDKLSLGNFRVTRHDSMLHVEWGSVIRQQQRQARRQHLMAQQRKRRLVARQHSNQRAAPKQLQQQQRRGAAEPLSKKLERLRMSMQSELKAFKSGN